MVSMADPYGDIRAEVRAMLAHGCQLADVIGWLVNRVGEGRPYLLILAWLTKADEPAAWLDSFVSMAD